MIDRPYFNSAPAEEGQEGAESPEGEESQYGEGQTAVINRDVCPDCKPGDTLTFKVLRVHDDELELQYQEEGGEEDGDTMEEPEPDAAAGGNESEMY